ncbi:hypothetical protein EST38_g10381 [Candolleomyces aberdarensis]|uniref:Uncharacterized protein n=1 Tax=Candolleomyces aberdarensis TaxID=2316362 RepID=A0A4Q2D9R0_9AGAR|nr:hypothetical protein EST38_g10381 [Candolleomyces aberdarensis]
MHLPTGNYTIGTMDYSQGGFSTRPLGLSRQNGSTAVVVLPEGTPPPQWRIEQVSGSYDTYLLKTSDKVAVPSGDQVKGSEDGAPFEWMIIRSAPHPPPVGNDAFAILVPGPNGDGWNYDSDSSVTAEKPVLLKNMAMPWYIIPARDYD